MRFVSIHTPNIPTSTPKRSVALACFSLTFAVAMLISVSSTRRVKADTSITPVTTSTFSAPSQASALITLDFTRAAVSDILSMIGREGNVDIIIGEDVVGTLKSVHLTDKTADQAIRMVAQSAGIPWKKLDSHTYLVGKTATSESVTPNSKVVEGAIDAGSDSSDTPPDLGIAVLKPLSSMSDPISTTSSVVIHNVKPSVMAYWLDPSHQPVPSDFKKSDERALLMGSQYSQPQILSIAAANKDANSSQTPSWAQPGSGYLPFNPYTQAHNQVGGGNSGGGNSGGGGSGNGNQDILASGAGTVALPQGVDNIIAIDAQNALLVRGTDEGIDRIREIISFLDRPIQQVEIEAQFVEVTAKALKQFGLTFTDVSNQTTTPDSIAGSSANFGTLNISITRGNVRASLAAAARAGLLRTLQAPRVTTFNNLTAQLVSVSTISVPITTTNIVQNQNGNPTQTTSVSFVSVPNGTVLTVIPTINRDGTVTISMQPLVLTGTVTRTSPDSLVAPTFTIDRQEINTSSNIKDGDTLAIGGLRTTNYENTDGGVPIISKIPIIGNLFKSRTRTKVEKELIIFVTARIVRRIDDPVPGT